MTTKQICRLKVALPIPDQSDIERTHPLGIVPVNLYFRPGLVQVEDLKNLRSESTKAILAVSSDGQNLPDHKRRLWPDGSVRSSQADIYLREVHAHNEIIPMTLSSDGNRPTKIDSMIEGRRTRSSRRDMVPQSIRAGLFKSTQPSFSIIWGNEAFPILNSEVRLFSDTQFTQDFLIKSSLPGGRWLELFLRFRVGSQSAEFWGQAGWNDRDDPNPSKDMPELRLEVESLDVVIDFDKQKISRANDEFAITDGRKVILSKAGNWNDGQSVTFHGVVAPIEDGADLYPTVWQFDASSHGAFSSILVASPSSAAADSAETWAASEMAKLAEGDAWQAGFWVPTEPGQTGDHAGFGFTGPSAAIFYGSGSCINLMRFSAYQEGCRPIWRRNNIGIVTDEMYRQAGVLMWDERPHPAGNLLGKNGPPNIYTGGMRSDKGQIWWGMDRQHGEDINWISYLTLVNDPLVRRMACDRAETWMAALRTDTGNTSIDGTDTGRGARMLAMLCRHHNLIPDQRFAARIRERVDLYARSIYLEGPSPIMPTPLRVIPQQVYDPSNQAGGLPVPHWRPWEDAIAAYALVLAYGTTGEPTALASAQALATNIALHGFETMADGSHRLYVALAYNSRAPLDEEQLKDPNLAKNSEGTGYHLWSYPALVTAWNSSIMLGEQKPDARPEMVKIMRIAIKLIGEIHSSTQSVFSRPWASYEQAGENSEWMGIEVLPAPLWFSVAAQPVS